MSSFFLSSIILFVFIVVLKMPTLSTDFRLPPLRLRPEERIKTSQAFYQVPIENFNYWRKYRGNGVRNGLHKNFPLCREQRAEFDQGVVDWLDAGECLFERGGGEVPAGFSGHYCSFVSQNSIDGESAELTGENSVARGGAASALDVA
jgi:hypothetical protein